MMMAKMRSRVKIELIDHLSKTHQRNFTQGVSAAPEKLITRPRTKLREVCRIQIQASALVVPKSDIRDRLNPPIAHLRHKVRQENLIVGCTVQSQ